MDKGKRKIYNDHSGILEDAELLNGKRIGIVKEYLDGNLIFSLQQIFY